MKSWSFKSKLEEFGRGKLVCLHHGELGETRCHLDLEELGSILEIFKCVPSYIKITQ